MLSVIMLSVIMLIVIMLSVIMLSVIMLSVIMLSVIMLNVVAPSFHPFINFDLKDSIFSFLFLPPIVLPCQSLEPNRPPSHKTFSFLHRRPD
jgi:hypothetical protein